MIIKGGGGEFERNPTKDIALFGLRDGAHAQATAPALLAQPRRLHDPEMTLNIGTLWRGDLQSAQAQATVTGTAALALWGLRAEATLKECQDLAQDLWSNRNVQQKVHA